MAKRKNPDTSNEAFRSLKQYEIQILYEKILWGLGQIGGGTFEEIAQAIKEPRDRVWRRMGELLKAGKVYRPGTKKALKSGREGYVWKLVGDDQSPETVTIKPLVGKSISDYSKKLIPSSQQQNLF